MPIGQRNPQNEPGTTGTGDGSSSSWAPDPATWGNQPAVALGPQWLRRRIMGALDPNTSLVTAQLPAPGPGSQYVLERIAVAGGQGFLLLIGSDPATANVVDGNASNSAALTVQSDPWPWRLGEQDSLFVQWLTAPTAPNLAAVIIQARVEAAR